MKRHIPALDGLRGLAILLVLICHVNHATGGPFVPGRLSGPVSALFGWGWIGVDLFFVLSGFLITGILFDAKGQDGYLRNFYARRVLRIMPLYYGFLFFAMVVWPQLPFAMCSDSSVTGVDALSLNLYFYNLRLAFTERALGFFHPFWSLGIEEHFYLVWPLVVLVLQRRSLMRFCLIGAAVSCGLRVAVVLSGAWPMSGFFLTPCRLDGLLAGSFVALAWRDAADWAWLQRWTGPCTLASGCLLLGIALGQHHFLPDAEPRSFGQGAVVDGKLVITLGIAALAVFFAGLVVLAVGAGQDGRWRRVLENSWLQAMGRYSYGIYVLHALILFIGVRSIPFLNNLPAYLAKPLTLAWLVPVSFLAAWLCYHAYEKHFLRLKRYFEYREPRHSVAVMSPQIPNYSNA